MISIQFNSDLRQVFLSFLPRNAWYPTLGKLHVRLKYKHGIQAVNRWRRVTLNCRRGRQLVAEAFERARLFLLLARGKLFETCSSARAPIFWEILQLPNIQDKVPTASQVVARSHTDVSTTEDWPLVVVVAVARNSSLLLFPASSLRALSTRERFSSKRICIPTNQAGR